MVKSMRKNLVYKYLFYFALALILCTCKDPVFYAISLEVKLAEPRIKGVPTNFVIYDGRMYVASGETLYAYNSGTEPDKTAFWSTEAKPGGNILQIASTGNYLYALCSTDQNNNGKTVIKRFDKENSSWPETGGIANDFDKIQNIFAAGDMLFIMASTSTYNTTFYTILYIDSSETINELIITNTDQNDTGIINGAACVYNDKKLYFLSTKDRGVYRIDDINDGAYLIKYKDTNGNDVNINFSGIINLQDDDSTILLVARNGEVYTVKDSIVKIENVSMGKMATGALAIWRENDLPSSNRLLLAGRQDSLSYSINSGYTYGYLELELDVNGIRSGKNFVEPGKEPLSTVTENERYLSTIGKYPLNYIFQVPAAIDSGMITFASTQKSGVWSYRERKGIFQWNAEE